MTAQEVADILKQRFPVAVADAAVEGPHPCVAVTPEAWHEVAVFLRDDPRLAMNMLRCISGVDRHPEPQIDVVYELIAMRAPGGAARQEPRPPASAELWQNGGTIAIRVRLPRDNPRVRSVADVWPAADWLERETFDLLGVTFDGHPDPRRILCPDDWIGHPLRKDYEFPKEYQGIPAAAAPESDSSRVTK
jgi:NADH-quinone oxidoreductase subunit C